MRHKVLQYPIKSYKNAIKYRDKDTQHPPHASQSAGSLDILRGQKLQLSPAAGPVPLHIQHQMAAKVPFGRERLFILPSVAQKFLNSPLCFGEMRQWVKNVEQYSLALSFQRKIMGE